MPVSSSEEFQAGNPDYACCTSRGSVVAFDASNGERLWKTYVMDEPKPVRKNSKGVQLYAPAGGSVWNSPTIDTKLNAIYFGTGDAETEPAAKTSDAVMALDLKTGKELWHYQIQENDAFMGGCGGGEQVRQLPGESWTGSGHRQLADPEDPAGWQANPAHGGQGRPRVRAGSG